MFLALMDIYYIRRRYELAEAIIANLDSIGGYGMYEKNGNLSFEEFRLI